MLPVSPRSLLNKKADEWGDQVTVVSCDMRHFRPSERADILVSELLGSFGDNELSPECLDGAQSFLRPGGISIPAAYTSYVTPLSSSKLWNEARACKEVGKSHEVSVGMSHDVSVGKGHEVSVDSAHVLYEHTDYVTSVARLS